MTAAVSPTIRDSLAIAFDVDDLVAARRLAKATSPFFGTAKIGLELFTAVGPDVVGIIADEGFKVFLDLKLHDNPDAINSAAKVIGSIGASYLTLHAFGGATMLRAGVDGLAEGAARAGLEAPSALAVTILTGDSEAPPYVLGNRVRAAVEGGCAGIVCSAPDVKEAKQLAPRLQMVVTGVRPIGAPDDEWQTAATPEAAVAAGADLMVLGRAITGADDPAKAAEKLIASLS